MFGWKFKYAVIAITILSSSNIFAQKTGSFLDLRDNKTYKTLEIGNQTWFAENLCYDTLYGCWAYNNDSSNLYKNGYLYNWETALKVCPQGWHLPTNNEWSTLINQMGGDKKSFSALKSKGFNLLFSGYRSSDGTFFSINEVGNWWSSTLLIEEHAWHRYVDKSSKKITLGSSFPTTCGFSVRCIKD